MDAQTQAAFLALSLLPDDQPLIQEDMRSLPGLATNYERNICHILLGRSPLFSPFIEQAIAKSFIDRQKYFSILNYCWDIDTILRFTRDIDDLYCIVGFQDSSKFTLSSYAFEFYSQPDDAEAILRATLYQRNVHFFASLEDLHAFYLLAMAAPTSALQQNLGDDPMSNLSDYLLDLFSQFVQIGDPRATVHWIIESRFFHARNQQEILAAYEPIPDFDSIQRVHDRIQDALDLVHPLASSPPAEPSGASLSFTVPTWDSRVRRLALDFPVENFFQIDTGLFDPDVHDLTIEDHLFSLLREDYQAHKSIPDTTVHGYFEAYELDLDQYDQAIEQFAINAQVTFDPRDLIAVKTLIYTGILLTKNMIDLWLQQYRDLHMRALIHCLPALLSRGPLGQLIFMLGRGPMFNIHGLTETSNQLMEHLYSLHISSILEHQLRSTDDPIQTILNRAVLDLVGDPILELATQEGCVFLDTTVLETEPIFTKPVLDLFLLSQSRINLQAICLYAAERTFDLRVLAQFNLGMPEWIRLVDPVLHAQTIARMQMFVPPVLYTQFEALFFDRLLSQPEQSFDMILAIDPSLQRIEHPMDSASVFDLLRQLAQVYANDNHIALLGTRLLSQSTTLVDTFLILEPRRIEFQYRLISQINQITSWTPETQTEFALDLSEEIIPRATRLGKHDYVIALVRANIEQYGRSPQSRLSQSLGQFLVTLEIGRDTLDEIIQYTEIPVETRIDILKNAIKQETDLAAIWIVAMARRVPDMPAKFWQEFENHLLYIMTSNRASLDWQRAALIFIDLVAVTNPQELAVRAGTRIARMQGNRTAIAPLWTALVNAFVKRFGPLPPELALRIPRISALAYFDRITKKLDSVLAILIKIESIQTGNGHIVIDQLVQQNFGQVLLLSMIKSIKALVARLAPSLPDPRLLSIFHLVEYLFINFDYVPIDDETPEMVRLLTSYRQLFDSDAIERYLVQITNAYKFEHLKLMFDNGFPLMGMSTFRAEELIAQAKIMSEHKFIEHMLRLGIDPSDRIMNLLASATAMETFDTARLILLQAIRHGGRIDISLLGRIQQLSRDQPDNHVLHRMEEFLRDLLRPRQASVTNPLFQRLQVLQDVTDFDNVIDPPQQTRLQIAMRLRPELTEEQAAWVAINADSEQEMQTLECRPSTLITGPCLVCTETKPLWSFYCHDNHRICLDCWRDSLVATPVHEDAQCFMQAQCGRRLPASLLRRLLPDKVRLKPMLIRLNRFFVVQLECPACGNDDPSTLESVRKTMLCHACATQFCGECNQLAHAPFACETWANYVQRTVKLLNSATQELTICPRCEFRQYREIGTCMHIICGRDTHGESVGMPGSCGHEYCFSCKQPWDDAHKANNATDYVCSRRVAVATADDSFNDFSVWANSSSSQSLFFALEDAAIRMLASRDPDIQAQSRGNQNLALALAVERKQPLFERLHYDQYKNALTRLQQGICQCMMQLKLIKYMIVKYNPRLDEEPDEALRAQIKTLVVVVDAFEQQALSAWTRALKSLFAMEGRVQTIVQGAVESWNFVCTQLDLHMEDGDCYRRLLAVLQESDTLMSVAAKMPVHCQRFVRDNYEEKRAELVRAKLRKLPVRELVSLVYESDGHIARELVVKALLQQLEQRLQVADVHDMLGVLRTYDQESLGKMAGEMIARFSLDPVTAQAFRDSIHSLIKSKVSAILSGDPLVLVRIGRDAILSSLPIAQLGDLVESAWPSILARAGVRWVETYLQDRILLAKAVPDSVPDFARGAWASALKHIQKMRAKLDIATTVDERTWLDLMGPEWADLSRKLWHQVRQG